MQRHGDEVELTEQEASGAVKPHVLRYMLVISLLLALVVLSVIWISGAALR